MCYDFCISKVLLMKSVCVLGFSLIHFAANNMKAKNKNGNLK